MTQLDSVPEDKDRNQISSSSDSSQAGDSLVQSKSERDKFRSKIPSPLVQQRTISTTLKFHRNGHLEQQIVSICLDRFKDWRDFIEEVNRTTSFPQSTSSIYTVNGVQILSTSQLEDLGNYVCVAAGESFKNISYNGKKTSSSSNKVATTRSEILTNTNINSKSSNLRPKSGSIKLRRANVTKSVVLESHNHFGDDASQGSSGHSGPNSLSNSRTFSEHDVSIPAILEYSTSLKSVIRHGNASNTQKPRPNSPSTSQSAERRTPGGSCMTSRIPKRITQNFGNGNVHTPRNIVSTPRLVNRRKTEKPPVPGEKRTSRDVTNSGREFVRPRLVTVIRSGMKPRKASRFLLNKKTAHSFDQVLNDLTQTIKPDWGAVRKVFSFHTKKEVTALEDFFTHEDIFLVCPNDKVSSEDFDLDSEECKSIQPYVKGSLVSSLTKRIKGIEGSKSPQRRPKSAHNPVPSGDSIANYPTHPKFIPLSHFPTPILDKYHVGNIIGDGNFAVVRECTDLISNQKFAMKVIDKSKCNSKDNPPSDEVEILSSIQHPNIILLYEQYDFSNELYLVMELVTGGDLFDLIAEATKFSEEDTARMTRDIASSLSFLHSHGIAHRDIKPENMLVFLENGKARIKLGDFGLAQVVNGPMYTICGTPTYVAPEVLAQTGYGMKVDIWALGVIIYVLLCGYPPFVSPTGDQEDLFDLILSGEYDFPPEQWDCISEDAKDLITRMIESDVDIRLCADEVLDHPFLAVSPQDSEQKRKRFFRRDFRYSVFEAMGLTNLPQLPQFT